MRNIKKIVRSRVGLVTIVYSSKDELFVKKKRKPFLTDFQRLLIRANFKIHCELSADFGILS